MAGGDDTAVATAHPQAQMQAAGRVPMQNFAAAMPSNQIAAVNAQLGQGYGYPSNNGGPVKDHRIAPGTHSGGIPRGANGQLDVAGFYKAGGGVGPNQPQRAPSMGLYSPVQLPIINRPADIAAYARQIGAIKPAGTKPAATTKPNKSPWGNDGWSAPIDTKFKR